MSDDNTAQTILELMREVEELTDATDWVAADEPSRLLVEVLPDNHWANARRSQVLEGLQGPAAALPYAQRALDTGFCCAKCTDQVARVLYANGDYVRATVASAVSLIITLPGVPGSSTSRLHTRELRQEALRFLITYIRGSGQHAPVEHPRMQALLALAFERVNELDRALLQWRRVQRDALDMTYFDVNTQHAILAFRLGKQSEAENVLQSGDDQDRDPATVAYEQLIRGYREGHWVEVARITEEMYSKMEAPDVLTWSSVKSATIVYSIATIAHSLANDREGATKAFQAIQRNPLFFNITRIAKALTLTGESPRMAAQELLRITEWDETGDLLTPIGLIAARRVIASLNTPRRSLTEAQLIHRIERQITVGKVPAGSVRSEPTKILKMEHAVEKEHPSAPVRLFGEIISLKRSYGFIRHPAFPNNVFFHRDDCEGISLDRIKTGTVVGFYVAETEKGPRASLVSCEG